MRKFQAVDKHLLSLFHAIHASSVRKLNLIDTYQRNICVGMLECVVNKLTGRFSLFTFNQIFEPEIAFQSQVILI